MAIRAKRPDGAHPASAALPPCRPPAWIRSAVAAPSPWSQTACSDAILIEISSQYAQMAEKRIREDAPLLTDVRVERGDEVAV